MVEPRAEHRRGAAVVLRGAEHHDHVGGLSLIELGNDQHEHKRNRVDGGSGEQQDAENPPRDRSSPRAAG
jgi:hypothetical protein